MAFGNHAKILGRDPRVLGVVFIWPRAPYPPPHSHRKPSGMPTKFIFVTGGVVSSLGKGIVASSLGSILEGRGLKVQNMKLDPYINVDPGTMSPFQHGEVYVLDDGAETDLAGHHVGVRFGGAFQGKELVHRAHARQLTERERVLPIDGRPRVPSLDRARPRDE